MHIASFVVDTLPLVTDEESPDGYSKRRLLHSAQFVKAYEGVAAADNKKVVMRVVKDMLFLVLSKRVGATAELKMLQSLPKHENVASLLDFSLLKTSVWLIREASSGVSLSMYVMVNEPSLEKN